MTLRKYNVLFSEVFRNQLFSLSDYQELIYCDNSNIKKLYSKIEQIKLILESFPEIYPIIKIKNNLVRKIVINQFIIIYQINYNQKEIHVLHIFHSKQNYLNLL